MRLFVTAALATLLAPLGCGSPAHRIDAGTEDSAVPDASIAVPVCRLIAEIPGGCEGACDGYIPACPAGTAAVCPRLRAPSWTLRDPWGCWPDADHAPACLTSTSLAPCDDGSLPTCLDASVDLEDPWHPGQTCGEACTGWDFVGCYNPEP